MAENSILNQIPFDPAYILIGLAVLVLVLLIVKYHLLHQSSFHQFSSHFIQP